MPGDVGCRVICAGGVVALSVDIVATIEVRGGSFALVTYSSEYGDRRYSGSGISTTDGSVVLHGESFTFRP